MPFLVQFGLVLLAIGAWTGWAVAAQLAFPGVVARMGVREPRRLLQIHLDYVIMGVLVIAVGAVLSDLPGWIQALVAVGTALNPLLFLPLAFVPAVSAALWFRALSVASFACVTAGLTGAAVIGLML